MKKKETVLIMVVLFANGAVSLMGVGFSTVMLIMMAVIKTVQYRKIGIAGRTLLACAPTVTVFVAAALTS